jgi:hypothetical protein
LKQSLKKTHSFAPSFNLRRANLRRANLRRASGDPTSLFKNVLKISNFKNSAKARKNLKKPAKKNLKFFFVYALLRLFDAKFFEFEEFTIKPFSCSSIQPQHTVSTSDDNSQPTLRH